MPAGQELHASQTSGSIFTVFNNGVSKFEVAYDGAITYNGVASYDDISVDDDATIGGDLAVTGTAATGALTVTGAASVSTNLTVSGGQIKDVAELSRIVFAPAKTITDAGATTLFTVPVAALASIGGLIQFHVFATDATDMQGLTGVATYAVVNKAGTLTSTISYTTAPEAKAVSAGTLTLAFSIAEDVADTAYIKVTPTGSLTESAYTITFTVFPQKGAVTIV